MKDEIKNKMKVDECIPPIVEERIKETINVLREEESSKSHRINGYRKIKLIGIVAIITVIFSNITFATVRNSLQEVLNRMKPMASQSYDEIKESLNQVEQIAENSKGTFDATVVTDKDITIRINEIAYDGTALIFKYHIEAKGINFPYEEGAVFAPILYTGDEKIENITSVRSVGQWISSTIYEGYYTMEFDWSCLVKGIKNNLRIGIKEIFEIKGNWEVSTNISLNDIYKEPKIYTINQKVNIQGLDVEIHELCLGTFSNQLNYTIYNIDREDDMKNFEKLRFFIIDEKGNCLNYQSYAESEYDCGEGISSTSSNKEKYNVKGTLELITFDTIPKSLTLIPYINYAYKSTGIEMVNIDDKNAKVNINQEFYIDINNMERQEKEIKMQYTYEGLVPERMMPPITFIDEQGNDITERENYNVTLDWNTGISYVSYKVEHPEKIKQIKIEKYFNCETLKEDRFIIKLEAAKIAD